MLLRRLCWLIAHGYLGTQAAFPHPPHLDLSSFTPHPPACFLNTCRNAYSLHQQHQI